MKKADIIIGQEYAYSRQRGRYAGHPSRVRVINRSDIPEGERVNRADSNANVLIVRLTKDGDFVTPRHSWWTAYEYVASRHIQRTWEEQVALEEEASRAREVQRARMEEARISRAEGNTQFYVESAEFARLLESLGVISEVEIGDMDDFTAIRAKDAAFSNGDSSGSIRDREVVLKRDAVLRLTEILKTINIDERNAA